jgi:hypothetical protein
MNAWTALTGLARNTAAFASRNITPTLLLFTTITRRDFSKYISKSAKKRLVLTTKRAHKGFYKGNRGTKEGRITSKGKFMVDPLKRMEIVVPADLQSFKVRVKNDDKEQREDE